MTEQTPPTPSTPGSGVTVGQAAKTAGVPVAVLRELCDAGLVAAHRTDRGHWYLHQADIPTHAWVTEHLQQRYRTQLAAARAVTAQLADEVEGVQLDLAEAADDPHATGVLGNDLTSFPSLSGSFHQARGRVVSALIAVELTHRHLQQLAAASPR